LRPYLHRKAPKILQDCQEKHWYFLPLSRLH